ncbi:MAG: hypothetical protein M1813_002989 [Trichoglossum hirsutum]|nr:MAG: hypothetical protein M1813_002989 [Trichoglossum hirsutum]
MESTRVSAGNQVQISRDNSVDATLCGTLRERLVQFFRSPGGEFGCGIGSGYTDADIQQVSHLLRQMDHIEWSRIPRVYIVLRRIGQLQLLDSFVDLGITDIWFPFSKATVPRVLGSSQEAFLQAQSVVLTKAIDLEKGGQGKHLYFGDGEPQPFETKGVLGEGGNSRVDKVVSLLSFNEYARKRIIRRKPFPRAIETVKSYERELELLKRLRHHHTVELVGSYTDCIYLGLLMSPVADCDLSCFLAAVPAAPSKIPLLRSFFGCLATGLMYLHNCNIRHKDIKPQNILVKGETVFLTDFGLSFDWTGASQSTTEGPTGKTPKYCAPEVAVYGPRNSSSDIWSLGCVFLEMTTALKGQTIEGMDTFFMNNGSGNRCFHSNPDAVRVWMEKLRLTGSESDNAPLGWVDRMLNRSRDLRPDARGVVNTIKDSRSCTGSYVDFIGICCSEGYLAFRVPTDPEGDTLMGDAGGVSAEQEGSVEHLPTNGEQVSLPAQRNRPKVKNGIRKLKKPPPSALLKAIKSGDFKRVRHLIGEGMDLRACTIGGTTPLHWAAEKGHEEMARLLLDSGAKADVMDKEGRTALLLGSCKGHEKFVQLMLDRDGVDLNTKDVDCSTPLSFAAENGHENVVRMLLQHEGIEPDSKDRDGSTPLSWAAWRGHSSVVEMLLQRDDVDPDVKDNTWGRTPLSYAAERGHEAVVQLLLERGHADPQSMGLDGWTPLIWASFAGQTSVVALLLQYNRIKPDVPDAIWGRTPLSYAAGRGYQKVVQLLIERDDVNPDSIDADGGTPFAWAAFNGQSAVVDLLLQRGVNPSIKDSKWGASPFSYAAERGHETVVRKLLERDDVDVNSRDNRGGTALEFAAMNGREEIIRLLLQKEGIEPDPRDLDSQTPLSVASEQGRLAAVELLLAHPGVDPESKDTKGNTPLMIARRARKRGVVKALERSIRDHSELRSGAGP